MTGTDQIKFRSDVAEDAHELASDLHRIGLINDTTLLEFDALCLVGSCEPAKLCSLREREKLSAAQFAERLGVTPRTLSRWKAGLSRPQGPAAVLLDLVSRRGIKALQ